ncbi:integration host factor subunit alpha [Neoehrlichia mikurensis]|uniref:Histone-like DNA-binding protein n=1 Tax=Neoehrlichia mikurensis TaxID=89586 RepID=A0A9Q9C221_9RICK|nr:integration host factor subunit alpha [Neoehrlichia mikurensis]QXK92242.1 integration host factor subunit alpha [Neoehrlichia mikurensis]QXK92697.1 integration host factor subunit alpha [Neoehrlichia mikurensis]QXK93935.1 integration host factor subunit alpha [Neoehrlichia mikurensis]UTO55904.1 integration host factor subunit alpha [Neoehrlichia mikurensis]UTO56820.1 integration host factor subunit alpha [Neoehrlichia mikurensis]
MTQTLTKAKIAEVINKEVGLSREDSLSIVGEILEEMVLSLTKEHILKISSFGTFKVYKKKERIGRNPRTLENFIIKEHNTISFYPSVLVKQFINSDES